MSKEAIHTLLRVCNWRLNYWTFGHRRCWTWRPWMGWKPGIHDYWSGKIRHYYIGPFELVHDMRGGPLNVMADICNTTPEELARRVVAKERDDE